MSHSGGHAPASSAPPPPGSWLPLANGLRKVLAPLSALLALEAASGVLLLVTTAIALIWANSAGADGYHALWHAPLGVKVGPWVFERSLEWFVNDVFMALFFFVVGLEIRKEVHDGQLSDLKRATLPAVAALGGMLAPAVLYLALAGSGAAHGWGIPMATDIAFAVGVLALLGKRVPPALRVLLLALAVIDDLGAILVIAFFYSSGISLLGLAAALLGVLLILALRAMGVRSIGPYVLPGVLVWAGVYAAGVHPTIAGVIVGLLTPVQAWPGVERESPADCLIHGLHPWVSFVIMPVFALANAGVTLQGLSLSGSGARVSLAIAVALVLGKPLGVVGLSALALRFKLARYPAGLSTRHLFVLGAAAGIGFTMSLFLAQLAFSDATLLGAAKLGVLVASALAVVLGLVMGRALLPAARA
jgi:Na+:H+ antiporter, NhaA family